MTFPFDKADDLIKNGPLFTDEAFQKHMSLCGIASRADFMKRVTPNLQSRWDEIERLEKANLIPASAKPDIEEYKKTLKDEAYLIIYFHNRLDPKAEHNINFKGQSKAMGDRKFDVWTPTEGYPMYISACNNAIKAIGAKLNTSLKGSLKINLASVEILPNFRANDSYQPRLNQTSLWA